MTDPDLEKLLGGFASNTLAAEERTRLYQAALQDQQLFNALADEQALKELLADPAVRRRLVQALQQPGISGAGGSLSWWTWFRRPAGLAYAGGLAAALFAIAFGMRIYQESLDRAAQSVLTGESTPAAPSIQQAQPSMQSPPSAAEPELKAGQSSEPARKEMRSNKPAKRERPATIMPQEQPAAKSRADNAMPRRERDASSTEPPMAAAEKAADQAAAATDRKLAATATPPATVPVPAAAPAPMEAPASLSAASAPAPKKSARALFYGQVPAQADRAERKMDQFPLAGKAAGASGQMKPFGLRYSFVILGSDGQSKEVNSANAASSKEPVRITVETTQDGYLQVLQNLGSAGTRLWWPPQETGKISLKLLAGKRSEIPMPPPAENGLLTLIIRLSTKPFGPLTMQEVGMLDRFSANLLTESVSPGGPAGIQEQATYVVSEDASTAAQIAVEIPISQ
jgi:hypothetical protein